MMPVREPMESELAISPALRRSLLPLAILASLLLAAGSLFLTRSGNDPLDSLFGHPAAPPIGMTLIAWCIVAVVTRRVIVGKSSVTEQPITRTLLLYFGAKGACLFAMCGLFACWLAALALGLGLATLLFKAFILLNVVNVFELIVRGACVNSLLLLRHLRAGR